jgi:DNA primase
LKFVFVPDGEDPDSLIRTQGQKAFEAILDNAMPLSKFLFEQLMQKVDMSSLEGRASLVESFQPYLSKLPDSILKDAMINEIANNFGTGSEQFLTKFTKSLQGGVAKPKAKVSAKVTPVRLALALLLEHPHIASSLGEISVLQPLTAPGIPLLMQVLDVCQKNPAIKSPQLLEYFRGTEQGSQLAKLMCWQHHVETEAATDVFLDSIEKLLNNFVEQRAEVLLQKAWAGQMTAEEKQELQAILNA